METLYLKFFSLQNQWRLTAAGNVHIGWFSNKEDAEKWASENNYKLRIQQ